MFTEFAKYRNAAIPSVLAAACLVTAGSANAGPGCMNDPRLLRGPVAPHAFPGQPAPYTQASPRFGYPGYAAGPRPGPMAYRQGVSTAAGKAAAAPATEAAPAGSAARSDHAAADAETVTVRIDGMRFEPANLSVTPGTTVTWVQGSRMPHTVNGSSPELRSGTLSRGQTFSFTFEEAGTYNYYCELHPGMTGTVTVEQEPGGRS